MGDRIYAEESKESFPFYVNRTLEKNIGSRVIDGWAVIGKNEYVQPD